MSEGASANPYGDEVVYELEVGRAGTMMPAGSASPSGEPIPYYWQRLEQEQNRYYQAALVEAPDVWLWDVLFAPVVKSYPFEVNALAATTEASQLNVWLQGASDFQADPDHHVRVYVNGSLMEEASWDGKTPQRIDVDLLPGGFESLNRLTRILQKLLDTRLAAKSVRRSIRAHLRPIQHDSLKRDQSVRTQKPQSLHKQLVQGLRMGHPKVRQRVRTDALHSGEPLIRRMMFAQPLNRTGRTHGLTVAVDPQAHQ